MGRKSKEESKRCVEYYQKNYPDWTLEQCEEAVRKFRKTCNWQTIEYWQNKFPDLSKEECERLRKKHQENKKSNNPNCLQYYIKRFPNLTEVEYKEKLQIYRDSVNPCIPSYWKSKYPEKTLKECEEIACNERKKRRIKSDNRGENNPMHRSKTSTEKRRSISPRCIEFYQTKYPEKTLEECEHLRQEFIKYNNSRIKNAVKPTNLEYYLNQGMSEEEAKIALYNRQCTFSLEKCIKKYGEETGIKMFNERQIKWKAKLAKSFQESSDGRAIQSKIANKLFDDISNLLNIKNPIKEKFIYDKVTKTGYAYDFCYGNKLIEFNGDYWHCNPKKYDKNFVNKTTKMTAQETWDKDKNKRLIAEKFGYKVYYVWEMDYKKDPSNELIKCVKFLQS